MEISNSLDSYSLTSMSSTTVCNGFVCLTDLPMTPESVPRTEEKMFIAEGLLNGNKKTLFAADSRDLKLSPEHKPIFMLRCTDGQWIELHNPAQEYLETVKPALMAAYFLNVVKHTRLNAPLGDVWPYVSEECRAINVKPNLDDLKEFAELIKSVVHVLQESRIFREFYRALGYENQQQEVSLKGDRATQALNTPVEATQALNTPVEVSGTQHLTLQGDPEPQDAPIADKQTLQEHGGTRNVLPPNQEGLHAPQDPELKSANDVYQTPTAPVIPHPNGRQENEDEGHISTEYSKRHSLPDLNVALVEGSSSGLHLTRDSATQALDTLVEVSGTQHLASPPPGKRTQGLAPEDPKLSCVNEVNRTPIPSVIPAQDPGLSSPNDVNGTPSASRLEEPGLFNLNQVYQSPIASLVRPEEPWLSDVNDVSRTPTAPLIPPEREPDCPHENEDEGLNLGVHSVRSKGYELPVLARVATGEATLAEGSSSGSHPTRDSASQALDTPVEVSGTQHLASPPPGDNGKGIAGEGVAAPVIWPDEAAVCAICDDGVNDGDDLLCCDYCMRPFHPTPASGLNRKCQSLCLSRPVSEIGDWLCPNCEAKQHQCFACGQLGNSDPASPLQEVFECDAPKCKRFYHPRCDTQPKP